MHTHHHEASHRCRYNDKSATWQTCTYVWVAVVVLSVVPHTRLGQGRQERARLVGSTRVHKLWPRHLAFLRAVLPPALCILHTEVLMLALLTTNTTPSLARHSGGFLPGSKAFAKAH